MWDRLRRSGLVLWRVYGRWQNDDGALLSAAVAYYLGLSLFPMLLLVISGFGMFFRSTALGQDAQQQVLRMVSEQGSPILAGHVQDMLDQVQHRSELGGRIGVIGLLIAAIAGFSQFERAFDHIWNVDAAEERGLLRTLWHTLINRGVAFLMLLAVGILVVAIFIAGVVIAGLQHYFDERLGAGFIPGPALRTLASISLNTALFTVLYRLLPPVKILWTEAVRTALFAACCWELGRLVLSSWVIGTRYTSAYGLVGSFLAVLLWCYYAVATLLLAAEYLKEISAGRIAGRPAERDEPPSKQSTSHPGEPPKDVLHSAGR